MIRKTIIFSTALLIFSAGCSTTAPAPANGNTAANSNPIAANANVAIVTDANTNPTLTMTPPAPPTNTVIPGIPNAPANAKTNMKDPTRDANIKPQPRPAPDNSEVSETLGQNLVRVRTFKNNAQIARVEQTTEVANNNKVTIKVFLRNGQTRELAEGKVQDPMTATAAEILAALGDAPKK